MNRTRRTRVDGRSVLRASCGRLSDVESLWRVTRGADGPVAPRWAITACVHISSVRLHAVVPAGRSSHAVCLVALEHRTVTCSLGAAIARQ